MKSLIFIWESIKKIFRVLFWLAFFILFIIFLLWLVGKVHPIFDLGLDKYLNQIKEWLKNL